MNMIRAYISNKLSALVLLFVLLITKPSYADIEDKAGALLAKTLGIDTETNCVTPTVDKVDCMFCQMFKVLFNAGSYVAAKSYEAFSSELGQLIIIFLAVSLALIILRNIATMGSKDPNALLNDIFTKTFVGIAIYIIVAKDYYNILNLTLSPIFDTGLSFVKSGNTTCANADGIIGYSGSAGSGTNGGLPMSVGTSIVCAVEDIERKINLLFEFGRWGLCRGNGPDRLFYVIPNPIYIIDGILLYLAGVFFMVAYPWVMADAVLQLGIAMAFLPFAVCGYAFQGTRSYLSKVFSWILHSLFVFMFMAILIMCILGYINNLLLGAMENTSDPKVFFENPNKGLAFYGPNMLKIIFILVIGWAYMPVIVDLADNFSKGSLGISAAQKIGAAVKQTVDSKTRKAADWAVGAAGTAAKRAGRVTKRRMQAGVRQTAKAGVKLFGKTNSTGGKTLRMLGYTFSLDRNADGTDVLHRDFKSITGRTHTMLADKYATIKRERTASGKTIRTQVKFKHGFVKDHLMDKNGFINKGALETLMNSDLAKDPENLKDIMTQLAIEINKARTGQDVGAYFSSRNVEFDPSHPFSLRMEQMDNTGKLTTLSLDIDSATGQVFTDYLVQRDKNSIETAATTGRKRLGRKLNIAALNSMIRRAGHDNGDGSYTWKAGAFVSYTAKKDANGQQYYERETKRFGFFGPTVKKTYSRNGVEIQHDTSTKLSGYNQKRQDMQDKLDAAFAPTSATGDRKTTLHSFWGSQKLSSHTDAATGEITYQTERKAGLFRQKTERTIYKNNEVITEYLDKKGNVLKTKTKHIDATRTRQKNIDGSSSTSYGNSYAESNEKYSGTYMRYRSNGLLNINETGRKTEGDIRDGSAKTAGEKTTASFSEYAQRGHDHISDRIDGNQIIEKNGTVARDLDPAHAGEDGYKGDLFQGFDAQTREKVNGKNMKDYIKDDVLVKMRHKGANRLHTSTSHTVDTLDVADFNGNIIGQADASGNILNSNGTSIGRISNGMAYDSSGRLIGKIL